MIPTLLSLFSPLLDVLRSRAALQAEILALRHQLLLLQRSNRKRRLQVRKLDRAFWVLLSNLWSGWRSALVIVKPATVIAWHRQGFRLYWMSKSRVRLGRRHIPKETRDLIRRMSIANPLFENFHAIRAGCSLAFLFIAQSRHGIYGNRLKGRNRRCQNDNRRKQQWNADERARIGRAGSV